MRKPSRLAAAGVLAAGLVLGACGVASADATANGVATNSPGFLSGNLVQIPVHIPINLCGNSVNVVGAGNPAIGNTCVNGHEVDGGHMAWQHHGWMQHHDDAANGQSATDDSANGQSATDDSANDQAATDGTATDGSQDCD
ncbi:chaplin [Streptacidiphilus neutrinimicus]|uniref:chaplin n=1 Tax=Streptacidiphilus neutrinimicus TaxID=105420 RepID=UPI0007C80E2E